MITAFDFFTKFTLNSGYVYKTPVNQRVRIS